MGGWFSTEIVTGWTLLVTIVGDGPCLLLQVEVGGSFLRPVRLWRLHDAPGLFRQSMLPDDPEKLHTRDLIEIGFIRIMRIWHP